MKWEELTKLADEEITYPFEAVLERWWPGADTITDQICAGVMVMEDAFDEDGLGEDKKAALIDGLMIQWKRAPIPMVVRTFIDPVLPGVLDMVIEKSVELMRKLFKRNKTVDLGDNCVGDVCGCG